MKIDLLGPSPVVIIGLMSGTSADAIDGVAVEICEQDGRLQWQLLAHIATPWPADLRSAILSSCRCDTPVQLLTVLNFRLGEEFARAARTVAGAAGAQLKKVAAIACHGQTIWHQPQPILVAGAQTTGTLQIGEAAVIAARTGCPVVADFRAADIAVGGQGAPLVPFADYLLFADPHQTRAVQNLGGIANVTFIPAASSLDGVVAFDTGPGNMVMDALASLATDGGMRYDRDGLMAAAGAVDRTLLSELLDNPYFARRPPKSTGREDFGQAYAETVFRRAAHLTIEDLMATALALTVETIAESYDAFLTPLGRVDEVILGGGGTRNLQLVARLRERLAPARVSTHSDVGIPDEAKEAAAFALLGYYTLRCRPANVPTATGAARPAILGKISLPPPE